jgi:hypothetical protein
MVESLHNSNFPKEFLKTARIQLCFIDDFDRHL